MTTADYAQLILAAADKQDISRIRDLATRLLADADDQAPAEPAEPAEPAGDARNATTDENGKAVIPPAKFEAMTADELVALQESDPDLYQRSLRFAFKHG